jgi:hypothetical protein
MEIALMVFIKFCDENRFSCHKILGASYSQLDNVTIPLSAGFLQIYGAKAERLKTQKPLHLLRLLAKPFLHPYDCTCS